MFVREQTLFFDSDQYGVREPSMFGTASFLGLRLIQAWSDTFGSSIVYKIMP